MELLGKCIILTTDEVGLCDYMNLLLIETLIEDNRMDFVAQPQYENYKKGEYSYYSYYMSIDDIMFFGEVSAIFYAQLFYYTSDKKEDIIDFINGWMSKVKKKRLENAEEWYNRTIARKKSRTFICSLGIFNSTLFYFSDSNFPGMSVF